MESLLKLEQKNLLDDLYNDTIKLYSKNPIFELLINLFVYSYNNKNVCPYLINEFRLFNEKLTSKLNDPNSSYIVFKDSLNDFVDKFKKIMEESKKLIEAYSYNFTEFYGLIFCYLNHYNYEDFMELFNKLDKSMENKKDLFEILLIYKHFFKKKIKFEKNFLEKFIIYSTENKDNNEKEENKKTNDKKHFLRFIEKALPYLDEINFYIHTININKGKIILIKDFQPIEITKFENYSNNFEETERDIDDILNFSKDKKILVIYFNNDFWSNIIKLYDEATQDNIKILKKLKILFEKYYTIVENVCKIKLIKTKASEFKDKDELSIKLDKIIIEYIKNKNDIENDEIVNLLVDFNPFYDLKDNQERYINKRNPEILDKLNFEKIDEDFINSYREKNFEKIFEQQMDQYMLTLTTKIENFSDFLIITKLFNIDNINNKKLEFIGLLEQKYNSLVKNINKVTDKSLEEKEVKEMIKNLAELLNFFCKKTELDSFKKKIEKLNQHILKIEILIELYQLPNNDENLEIKSYIKDYFLKILKETQLKDVINFIKNLKNEEDYLDIMDKLSEKYMIDENDFFSSEKIIKIKLLSSLKENDLLKEEEKNNYLAGCKGKLDKIYRDIDGNTLSINKLNTLFLNTKEDETLLKKLNLLCLTNQSIVPENILEKLKRYYEEISENIKTLEDFEKALEKYHGTKHRNDIEEAKEIVKVLKNGDIKNFLNAKVRIEKLKYLVPKVKKINEVKEDEKIFKIIYSQTKKNKEKADEDYYFEEAYKNYNDLKNPKQNTNNEEMIHQLLDNCEEKDQEEIRNFLTKFGYKNPKNNYKNIRNSEKKINSIFTFFDNFGDNNDVKWKKYLSIEYKDISKKKRLSKIIGRIKK